MKYYSDSAIKKSQTVNSKGEWVKLAKTTLCEVT